MAIIKITDTTDIAEGKFVCAASGGRNYICTYPRKVTRVSGKRIYFVREDEDRVQYMTRDRAAYLCDTADEGKALCNLGIQRGMAVEKAEEEARRNVLAEYAPKMAALMRGEAPATDDHAPLEAP